MKYKAVAAVLLAFSIISGAAVAQDKAAAKPRARGGIAAQVDLALGGAEFTSISDPPYTVHSNLGDGATVSLGVYFRPSESKPWELQGFIGYKRAGMLPVSDYGNEGDVSRWVVQVLASYHYENKWYYGGGLAFHDSSKYEDRTVGVPDIHFQSGVGVTVEGGWSWLGMQCTYIEYGSLDASNCGVRFTWRFRRWGPLH